MSRKPEKHGGSFGNDTGATPSNAQVQPEINRKENAMSFWKNLFGKTNIPAPSQHQPTVQQPSTCPHCGANLILESNVCSFCGENPGSTRTSVVEVHVSKEKKPKVRYCSAHCEELAAKTLSVAWLTADSGPCTFCMRSVIYGQGHGTIMFPYRNQKAFLCPDCIPRAEAFMAKVRECCLCGKPL